MKFLPVLMNIAHGLDMELKLHVTKFSRSMFERRTQYAKFAFYKRDELDNIMSLWLAETN